MFFIFDYNLEQVFEILKSCENVESSPHVLDNWLERNLDFNYIQECIINKIPLSISKTMENRFKLIYPHKTKHKEDLYIIIEITDYKEVKVITVYSFSEKRRKHNI